MLYWEQNLMADMKRRSAEIPEEDVEDWRLPEGVELGLKWRFLPEELDLTPISTGVTTNYATSGGCDEATLAMEMRDSYGSNSP